MIKMYVKDFLKAYFEAVRQGYSQEEINELLDKMNVILI